MNIIDNLLFVFVCIVFFSGLFALACALEMVFNLWIERRRMNRYLRTIKFNRNNRNT